MFDFDLHPYTLLISVFTVLILKQIVNSIGKNNIQEAGWILYTKVAPKLGNKHFNDLANTRKELFRINKEKKSISAQDEYARWTKLNRQSDKLNAQITELQEESSKFKGTINKLINALIMVMTTLPIWFFRVWFRKSVLFYLPYGVLPYYMEWLLAFPFTPLGGIGLTVWMYAVNNVISTVIFIFKFLVEEEKHLPQKPVATNEATKESD